MPFLARTRLPSKENTIRAAEDEWASVHYSPSLQRRDTNNAGWIASSVPTQSRRLCGSAECANGWRTPWRNRQRPIFEQQWGCSGRCTLWMVRAAIGRESGETSEFFSLAPHRHRVPLGLLMLAQGWITHPQLRTALEAQRENGTGQIGQWLVNRCEVGQEQVTRALGMQWGCPVLTLGGFLPGEMALVLPRMLVERFGLVPIRVAGSKILYVGFSERLDATAALALEKMSQLKVESGVVSGTQLEIARKRLFACDGVEARIETPADAEGMAARITAILEQKQPIASRLVRIHEYYWLRLWLERGAVGSSGTIPKIAEDVRDYLFTLGSTT